MGLRLADLEISPPYEAAGSNWMMPNGVPSVSVK
jgi:hypothetical protein